MKGRRNSNGYGTDLTNTQRSRLEASQEMFNQETQGLREKIQDQRDVLQAELNSDHPDADKVGRLQKTLSGLQADYSQKVVRHQLELRKIAPGDANGQIYGGYGKEGYGGYCWK